MSVSGKEIPGAQYGSLWIIRDSLAFGFDYSRSHDISFSSTPTRLRTSASFSMVLLCGRRQNTISRRIENSPHAHRLCSQPPASAPRPSAAPCVWPGARPSLERTCRNAVSEGRLCPLNPFRFAFLSFPSSFPLLSPLFECQLPTLLQTLFSTSE